MEQSFKCKCVKCNKEESFDSLKAAFLSGWNFGRIQVCYDCQKNNKNDKGEEIVNEVLTNPN